MEMNPTSFTTYLITNLICMLLLPFTEYDCLDGYMKCNDGLACFEKQSLCDGWPQCRDFSDEDKERCAGICEAYNRITMGTCMLYFHVFS
jgi:hypothetical protein